MNIGDIEQYSKNLNRKIFFDYELKKTNWFNIGGKAKIYFKPETLQELIEFLKLYNNRGKIFVIGAGSNILFQDGLFNGVVIKFGVSPNIEIFLPDLSKALAPTRTEPSLNNFAVAGKCESRVP